MSQGAPAIEKQPGPAAMVPGAAATVAQGRWWRAVLLVVAVGLALFLLLRPVVLSLRGYGSHYLYLARHLSQGDLTVDTLPSRYQDHVEWNGHKYLPLGPLPVGRWSSCRLLGSEPAQGAEPGSRLSFCA